MVCDVSRAALRSVSKDNGVPEAEANRFRVWGSTRGRLDRGFWGPLFFLRWCSGLAAHQGAKEEEKDRRALGDSSHEVRIPGGAIGHVGAHSIALFDEFFLQLRPNAVEHLDLEVLLIGPRPHGREACVVDEL